jgi:sugar/nucleoside kinase (ribokinase family)
MADHRSLGEGGQARRMFDLFIAGEAFDDLIFYGLDDLPEPGHELKTDAFVRSPGGGAVITAVAAARLGLRCGVASGLGEAAAKLLGIEGISVHNLRRRNEPGAITVALSTRQDRRFVTFTGMNDRLPGRVRHLLPRVRARHVHLALNPGACRLWIPLLARLRRRRITTSWDFGWNPALARDPAFPAMAASVDYLLLNRNEALLYAGRRTLADAIAFWRRARSPVIIKLGSAGSRIAARGIDVRAAAPKVRAVDTTGAGDAFNAGFLAAVLRGADLHEALLLGNRIGALSTRRPGGIAGLPE